MSDCRPRALLAALVLLPGGWLAVPAAGLRQHATAALAAAIFPAPLGGERGSDPQAAAPRYRRATATLRAAGGQPRFTTYPGVGHGARPGLFDRLLAQRRSAALGHPKRP